MTAGPILGPIPENRDLTAAERDLVRWMLEHGEPRAASFLGQLECASVVSRCGCGCASINFEVDGKRGDETRGLRILGDFVFGDDRSMAGCFVFECDGVLSGIEVYSLDGRGDAYKRLPCSDELAPAGFSGAPAPPPAAR